MKELETEIRALKGKLAASKTGDSELNSGGQNQNNVDLDPASFPTQDIEVDLPKTVETGIILWVVQIKKNFNVFLKKGTSSRFSELIKNPSDVPRSETYVYFKKITATTWPINKIIPVSIALDLPTATDALASEAAFMENIGLYLKPRQSLTKGRLIYKFSNF